MQMQHFYLLILILSTCYYQTTTGTQLSKNIQTASSAFDGAIIDLQWCGVDPTERVEIEGGQTGIKYEPRRVFALTIEGSVYFSENEGQTWMAVKRRFKEIQNSANNDLTSDGFISKIIVSELDSNLMIFLGTNGTSIYTSTCGKNFLFIKHPRLLVDMQLSKTKTNWIIGIAKYTCKLGSVPCPTSHALYYSLDLGISWAIIANRVIQYAWGNDRSMEGATIVPETRIIITTKNNATMETIIQYSDDFFNTSSILAERGFRFQMFSPFLFVQKEKIQENDSSEETENEYELEVSATYYNPYVFNKVEIPIEDLKDKSFTILDSQEGTIFINVNHHGPQANFGNVYVSDMTATKYQLSQQYNVRDLEGNCDFYRAEGFEGVYIGNFYDEKAAENHLKFLESGDKQKSKTFYENIDNYKRTLITYDRGSTWQYLPAPQTDCLMRKINCTNCYLHLRGATEADLNPLYSRKNAIGIIIGVGNVGAYLSSGINYLNTYFTRDGGNSWEEIAKGSHIYEIGDNGGLIVMAKDTQATNKIIYSWDEGLTWEEYQFVEEPIWVRNVVIESQNMAVIKHFLIIILFLASVLCVWINLQFEIRNHYFTGFQLTA